MNFNKILTIFLILFLTACQQIDGDRKVITMEDILAFQRDLDEN